MTYITIDTSVDIDYRDFSDSDVLEILEDRLDTLKRRKDSEDYKEFFNDVMELLNDKKLDNVVINDSFEIQSLQDEYKLKTCFELMKKYSLEELENLINK